MGLKYRVKGKVEYAFILRGIHFASGMSIDLTLNENELNFIKDRCINLDILKLNKESENSLNNIQANLNNKKSQGGLKNDISKRASNKKH